ncbi:unnamed protein product [Darwinula stevensoni]|uniref:Uncharacterized protein n=1 Tax=Darwinula stevensoni TaxID=69355 RepID=A0A7R8X9U1_9CRUS|nr:unnamed protein product [Darwinula stevensoni]CAG0884737.1 unnamed protein product [Darwinula stevensoni]
MIADAMEKKVQRLEKDLEEMKRKYELQCRRSHQLVEAFQLKMQEKETELQRLKILQDCQLRNIIKKLLHVEVQLRKEKVSLTRCVQEKESCIQEQREELERLRGLLCLRKNGVTNSRLKSNLKSKSDSDIVAGDMKIVRVGSSVSFLLQNGGRNESDEEDTKSDSDAFCDEPKSSIIETINCVLNGSSPSPKRSPCNETQLNQTGFRYGSKDSGIDSESPNSMSEKKDQLDLIETEQTQSETGFHIHLKDVSDHMVRQNFEEFKLENVDDSISNSSMDETCEIPSPPRQSGDGEPTSPNQLPPGPDSEDYRKLIQFHGSYDKFLEATGLSQKSILTPSRIMTNHRSVTKPKDVKNRSRWKAASNTSSPEGDPQEKNFVKYWAEPNYL